MALLKNHPITLCIATAVFLCNKYCSSETIKTSPEVMSKSSPDDMKRFFEQRVAANETDADDGSPSSTAEKLTGYEEKGCLALTYNYTKHIYEFPDHNYYIIWFNTFAQNTEVKLQFDYSRHVEGDTPIFADYSKFTYRVKAWRWHQIELVKTPEHYLRLKIPTIKVDEDLPHTNIAHLQVSTDNGLTLWSSCPPQDNWWDEEATDTAPHGVPVSTIIMSISLSVTLLIIIILGFYTYRLSVEVKKRRQMANEELL